MKKGQIEIMGFVVVIVLVTIGLFFSVSLQRPQDNSRELDVYRNEKLASDFLITFLETKHNACDVHMRELALDCIRAYSTGVNKYSCASPPLNSCDAISEAFEEIFAQTLDVWGNEYLLTYTYERGNVQEVVFSVDGGCDPNAPRDAPGIQPIVLYPHITGKAWFKLDLCR